MAQIGMPWCSESWRTAAVCCDSASMPTITSMAS
jgi:hypothetical protein